MDKAASPPPVAVSASAAALSPPLPPLPKHPLVGVHNFRDVGTSVVGIRASCMFRSGAPLKGSHEDLTYIVTTCKVKTMIDLRSDRERELDDARNNVHTHFPTKYDFSQQRPTGDESRRYHTVHLTGAHFVMRLLWESPITTSMKAIGYAVRGAPEKATLELITSLNGRGLLNLYRMFLDCSQNQICQVLHLFSSRENYPIHYFCSLGKDRTGIITDYSRSREDVALTGDMKAAMKDTGLSEEFLDSPKEVMVATLAYLDAQYNGPKAYLERIGVSRATQEKIKAILGLPPGPPPIDAQASQLTLSAPPPSIKQTKAQSMIELSDSKLLKKERKKEKEKKERKVSSSSPPKITRPAASSSNLVEVMDDAAVVREGNAQVYVWDPNAHKLQKEKQSGQP